MQDLVLLIDEVDLAAPTESNPFSWHGSEHFTKARFLYGCGPLLTAEEREALNCPVDTVFRSINRTEETLIQRELKFVNDGSNGNLAGSDHQLPVQKINDLVFKEGEKVIVFCEDEEAAKEAHAMLVDHVDSSFNGDEVGDGQGIKKRFFHFDPEEEEGKEKAKITRTLRGLEDNPTVRCVVTWKVGIRGVNYWK